MSVHSDPLDPNYRFTVVVHIVGPELVTLNFKTKAERDSTYGQLRDAMKHPGENIVLEFDERVAISTDKISYVQKGKNGP